MTLLLDTNVVLLAGADPSRLARLEGHTLATTDSRLRAYDVELALP